jgi:methyl-accepting chemotaxis protein
MKTCWDHGNCSVKNECPAHPRFGRNCFAVAGTLCRGEVQGAYQEKIEECRKCSFYLEVMELSRPS